jgi:23S rRNA (uridine2552-2'-O)-methyltransferase
MKPPSGRERKTHVKNKRMKDSSKQWLNRHLNDPYVHKANAQGYRSRAAFKLIEMNEKLHLIKPGMKVVDLGAAPGGWSQVLVKKKMAHIAAIDILPMDPIDGVDFIEMDFTDNDAPDKLKAIMKGEADLVLSDLSPNTTGHQRTDHLRMMGLVEMAWDFAKDVLKPGGAFVTKVFQGGAENEFLAGLKPHFKTVKHVKPPASRAESSEVYLIGMGFRK